ncbi:ROK family protein [Fervidibacillus halotolerans]|uniref:fructokinase n=1 Tax=Fervidibacillus halotolerans TaxID=2980027 RepID=A0A9E8RX58_9BACI|nr:ROK family protein [Fervidibacillus halotolerans]WAA12435.1 ROK family protein [Fervidibacillus halotolerans]
MYFGAIEAGGTKFVCAVGDKDLQIIDQTTIPTTTPKETMKELFRFFDSYSLVSMGIGSFGPIDVKQGSPTYGHITNTPKKGWTFFNFVGSIKEKYDIPVAWTTDVNAAAYGEWKNGAAKGLENCLYLTVGTGIGGGAIVNGKLLEGFSHPEMGHILLQPHPDDSYEGHCPFHKNCLEGLASGPAIEGRYGKKGIELSGEDQVWEMEAYYIAQALMNYSLILRPDQIILGGGVMKQEQLFPLIRKNFESLLNHYIDTPDLSNYIVSPKLGDRAGITGALNLASEVVETI